MPFNTFFACQIQYISDEMWNNILSTYDMGSYQKMWEALNTSIELFRETSHFIAETFGYKYPNYDEKVSKYIESIRKKYTQI